MERDPFDRDQGGSDVRPRSSGATSATSRRRRSATPRPDYLAPIDDSAPVSGHTPPPETGASAADIARARLGARQGPRVSRASGRSGRRASRSPRSTCWPPPPTAGATPSRSSTRARPGCRSSTRSTPARSTSSSTATTSSRGAIGPVDAAGRGDAEPGDLVGGRAVDRRDLRRTPSRQLRHRRRLGCRADPAARRRRPPDARARTPRAGAHRPARNGTCSWPARCARTTTSSRRCSPTSCSRPRAAPTSRSTGGCSSWSAGGSSSSRASRRTDRGRAGGPGLHDPPLEVARRGRDDHARSARGAQRADRASKLELLAAFERVAARSVRPRGRADRRRPGVLLPARTCASGSSPTRPRSTSSCASATTRSSARCARSTGRSSARSTGSRPAPARRWRSPATCGSRPNGASFLLAFGRVGLDPGQRRDVVAAPARRPGRAAEMALLTEPLSAPTRSASGSSCGWCPADQLMAEARAVAVRLAGVAPRAVALTKRALDDAWDSSSRRRSRPRRASRARPARRPTTPRASRPSSRSGRRGSPGSRSAPVGGFSGLTPSGTAHRMHLTIVS